MADVGNGYIQLIKSTSNISSFTGYHAPESREAWVSYTDESNAQTTLKTDLVDSTFAASFALNMLALDVHTGTALYELLDQLGVHYSTLRAPVNIVRQHDSSGTVYYNSESFLSIVTNKILLKPIIDTYSLRSYLFGNNLNSVVYLDSDTAKNIRFYFVRRVGAGGSNTNDSFTSSDYTTLSSLTTVDQAYLDDYKANGVQPPSEWSKSIDAYEKYQTGNKDTGQEALWSVTANGLPDCNLYLEFDEVLLKQHSLSINYSCPATVKQVKGLRLYAHCNSMSDVPDMLLYQDEKFNLTIIEEPVANFTIDDFLVSNYQLSNSEVEYPGYSGSLESIFTLTSVSVKDLKYQIERSSTASTELFDTNTTKVVTGSKLKSVEATTHGLAGVNTSQLSGTHTALYNCSMLINIGYIKSNERTVANVGVAADITMTVDACNFGSAGHYAVHAYDSTHVATALINYKSFADAAYYNLPPNRNIDTVTIEELVQHYYYVLLPLELEIAISSEDDAAASSFYKKFNNIAKRITQGIVFPAEAVSQDAVDTTMAAYEKWIHNNIDKSQYRTPMEYYNEVGSVQEIEGYASEKLSNDTNSSTTTAPTYFWVETLKNWCTYTLNVIDATHCHEAELLVWNGLNGWMPLSNILAFYKENYVPYDVAKNLQLDNAHDNLLFQKFNLVFAHKMTGYNFPVEQLHTVEIDRVYSTVAPNLKGKGRSWFESLGHGIMTALRGVANVAVGVFQTVIALPASLFTDKNAWEYTKDGWSNVFKGWLDVFEAIYVMPLKYAIEQIMRMIGDSNTNSAFYLINFGKQLYARCFYVKLPYDSGYSSNDATTYQTVRLPKRAEKAYGAIDGGIINRTTCAAYNIIPTTIGSPFVTRSSTGELMMAYKMAYSGPIREFYSSHEDLIKYSGITSVDIEFSNQLLRKTLGSGEDKTINDWLTTFDDNFANESVAGNLNTSLASGAIEQHNQTDTALATLKITATRNKATSDVENTEINTLTKW